MPFNASFIQSFSSLQVEVAELQGGYNEMRHDIHQMFECMESIEAGVTYFRE